MENILYPLALPEILSPRGWWTALFVVGCALLIRWMTKETSESKAVVNEQTLADRFANWKKQRQALKKQQKDLPIEQFTQQLYVVYAQGLDMLVSVGVEAKSLQEIEQLTKTATIKKKEKTLFGRLYTPLFAQEGWSTKQKNTMLDEVYALIDERYKVLLPDDHNA